MGLQLVHIMDHPFGTKVCFAYADVDSLHIWTQKLSMQRHFARVAAVQITFIQLLRASMAHASCHMAWNCFLTIELLFALSDRYKSTNKIVLSLSTAGYPYQIIQ